MKKKFDESKRKLIATGLALAGGLVAPAVITRRAHAEEPESMTEKPDNHESEGEEEVTPPEDLMREHGVLDRVLLIYEAVMRKFGSNEDFDPAVIPTRPRSFASSSRITTRSRKRTMCFPASKRPERWTA